MNRRPHEDALRARWALAGAIPLAGVAPGSSWERARTTADGRDVTLLIVEGENALETADAARRAVLVQDERLMEVLDVRVLGEDREDDDRQAADDAAPTTVVEYPVPPAPPLAAMLAKGPMHPETARSVIGEAATALEVARRRGIRHQYLDSNRIFVDPAAGHVMVLGVGVEAASHGRSDRPGPEAAERDVSALVTLLYRALTGHGPRRAAEGPGEVPRASSLAPRAIPEDLDRLCDLVLNHRSGPTPATTRELIEELGPWQSIPVTLEAYDPQGATVSQGGAAAVGTADDRAADASGDGATDGPAESSPSTTSAAHPDAALTDGTDDEAEQQPGAAPAAGGAALGGAALATAAVGSEASDWTTDGAPVVPAHDADASASGERGDTEPDRHDDDAVDADSAATRPAGAEDHDGPTDPGTDAEPAATEAAGTESSGSEPAASPEDAYDRPAAERQEFIERLHLAERRNAAAFPAAMSIDRAQAATATDPAEPHEDPAVGAPAHPEDEEQDPTAQHTAVAGTAAPGMAAASVPTPASSAATPEAGGSATASSPATPSEAPFAEEPDSAEQTQILGAPVVVPDGEESRTGPIIVPGRSRSFAADPPPERLAPSPATLWRDVVGVAMDAEPEVQEAPVDDPTLRSRRAPWILIGFALLLIAALVAAISVVTSSLRDSAAQPVGAATSIAAPAKDPTSAAPEASSADPTTAAPAAPPQISGVQLVGADGLDHEEDVQKATDGNPATFWPTKMYRTPTYGGLRQGMGLRVDLAAPAQVKDVVVTGATGDGGRIELTTVNPDGSRGQVVATGAFAGGSEVRLTPEQPMDGAQSLIVWIPELPRDGGSYRAKVAEIRVE